MPTPCLTADGSHTLATDAGVLYHSHHGAVQESRHIFIEAGLKEATRIFPGEELRVLEIGFGTGLNALLAALEAESAQRATHYTTTELYPISGTLAAMLNYPDAVGGAEIFRAIHATLWEEDIRITSLFTLRKLHLDATSQPFPAGPFHCIFFDAFAPEDQPELWSENVFVNIYARMVSGGLLTTYCSKGTVRRAMQTAGFVVEKIPGPPGKREIVRATKGVKR